jgi:hypothetical protein
MTWHYIFAKNSHRLLKYQRLTAHIHPATVEDQFRYFKDGWRIRVAHARATYDEAQA